ncbi:hypothetical protein M0R04_08095 [Candidatus Dojkabacteria bacterium]|jgi:hypothetical protein|nr:hypothetical protein [Candidatus Dojkabacteria bacterium]
MVTLSKNPGYQEWLNTKAEYNRKYREGVREAEADLERSKIARHRDHQKVVTRGRSRKEKIEERQATGV